MNCLFLCRTCPSDTSTEIPHPQSEKTFHLHVAPFQLLTGSLQNAYCWGLFVFGWVFPMQPRPRFAFPQSLAGGSVSHSSVAGPRANTQLGRTKPT